MHIMCHLTSGNQFLDYQIMIISARPIPLSGAVLHPFRLLLLHKKIRAVKMKHTFETSPLLALALLCNKHDSLERQDPLGSNDKRMIPKKNQKSPQCILDRVINTEKNFPICFKENTTPIIL